MKDQPSICDAAAPGCRGRHGRARRRTPTDAASGRRRARAPAHCDCHGVRFALQVTSANGTTEYNVMYNIDQFSHILTYIDNFAWQACRPGLGGLVTDSERRSRCLRRPVRPTVALTSHGEPP